MTACETIDGPALDLKLTAEAASVTQARLAVVELARGQGFSDPAVHALAVAVSEAASNVVVHAYAEAEPGPLIVHAEIQEDELVVAVSDEGGGVRPRLGGPGLGLGLALIAALASQMEVGCDEAGRNVVTMRFGRSAGPTSLRTTRREIPSLRESPGA